MAQYRIVCVRAESTNDPLPHTHIAQVGTGKAANICERVWSVQEVYDAMDNGDRFWTYGKQSRRTAWVEKHYCEHCYAATLRSAPEAGPDNSLNNLPQCD